MDTPQHDVTDNTARSLAMALQSVLIHLFRDLEEKGLMTPAERNQILSDAVADHVRPQETVLQERAVGLLQEMKRVLNGGHL